MSYEMGLEMPRVEKISLSEQRLLLYDRSWRMIDCQEENSLYKVNLRENKLEITRNIPI